ncbi:hypothetical protein pb186bvf_000881 [Paramecium bursaria]
MNYDIQLQSNFFYFQKTCQKHYSQCNKYFLFFVKTLKYRSEPSANKELFFNFFISLSIKIFNHLWDGLVDAMAFI